MPRLEPEVAPINTLPEVAPNNAARAEPRWRRAALSGATSGDVLIGANSDSERGVYTATERRIGRLAAEYVFSSENVSIDGGKLRILHESEMG